MHTHSEASILYIGLQRNVLCSQHILSSWRWMDSEETTQCSVWLDAWCRSFISGWSKTCFFSKVCSKSQMVFWRKSTDRKGLKISAQQDILPYRKNLVNVFAFVCVDVISLAWYAFVLLWNVLLQSLSLSPGVAGKIISFVKSSVCMDITGGNTFLYSTMGPTIQHKPVNRIYC